MASPQTATWWSSFLNTHGSDSEEESAFLGYLTMHEVSALDADSADLEAAYAAFRTFMDESAQRGADPGPSRAELAAQQAVAEVEKQFVAKSRVSTPGVEKPQTAATRPAALRTAPEAGEEAATEATPAATTETAASETTAAESESRGGRYGGRRGSD